MKLNYLSFVLVVAACIGCGGNNPVPTKGMFNSGSTAEGIQFNQNKQDLTSESSLTKTIDPRTQLGNNNITPKDDFVEVKKDEIISPAKQFDVPKEHFEIQAEAGGTIRYDKTGSTVMIPPDALMDKNGKDIKGDVDISYREFHTIKEIFFSGIPMDYHVNGEKCFFQSAGMIDISASQNGEEVFLKKGKEIKFNMSTDNTHEEVKLYELDKANKKWIELGDAPVINTPTTSSTPKKIWSPVYKTVQEKYTQFGRVNLCVDGMSISRDPLTNKKEKYLTLRIRISSVDQEVVKEHAQQFKDAKVFSKLSFVLTGMNKKQFRKMMSDLKMPPHRTYSDYFAITEETKIEFIDAEYPNKITIRFTYDNKQVDAPIDVVYNYNMSKRSKTNWFTKLSHFNMNEFPVRTKQMLRNSQEIDHYDSIAVSQIYYNKSIVQRQFASRNFGVLNCDQPQKLPVGMIANAAFNADGKEISPYDVTLVDFEKNTLFTYYNYMFPRFQFNPNTQNLVFTMLNDGNIGCMLPDEFSKIQQDGDMNFNLHVITIEQFEKLMEQLFPSKNDQSYTI